MTSEVSTSTSPAPSAPKKSKAKAAAAAPAAVDEAVLAGIPESHRMWFKDNEFAPCEPGVIEIPAKDAHIEVDVRTTTNVADKALTASFEANGILQMPIVTRVRDRATKTERWMVVAGRHRVAWAVGKGATIRVDVLPCTDLQRFITLATTENVAKVAMTDWEYSCTLRDRVQLGMTPTALAAERGTSTSQISQHLAIMKFDDAVLNPYMRGKVKFSHMRELVPMAKAPDKQAALIEQVVDKGWSVERLRAKVDAWKSKEATKSEDGGEGEGEGGGKKRGRPSTKVAASNKYFEMTFTPIKKTDLPKVLTYYATAYKKEAKKDDADDVKLAKLQGIRQGLEMAGGIGKIPDAALAVEPVADAEESE